MNRKAELRVLAAVIGVVFFILCNNNPQENGPPGFMVEATASDSVIAVRDTLAITVDTAAAAGWAIRYCWVREDSWTIDTTGEGRYSAIWQFPDTGLRRIIVWAIGSTGWQSNRDTVIVRISCFPPGVSISGADSAVIGDTVVLHATGSDSDGTVERFEWRLGGQDAELIATVADSLEVQWTKGDSGQRTIVLWAIDNDGLRSAPDSLAVTVTGSRPYLTLSGDSAVSINDTVRIVCNAADDDGTVAQYQWSTDPGGRSWLTTPSDTFVHLWRLPDTGMHFVRCRVVDNAGLVSPVDSAAVHVSALPPRVSLLGPLHVRVGDSAVFTAPSADDDGRVVRYQWSIESSAGISAVSGVDSTLTVVWGAEDGGSRVVGVAASDDDSLKSTTARCTVLVSDVLPRMVPIADTTLSSFDTLVITRTLIDTSRRAALYFWDIGGNGWDDSTVSPQRVIAFNKVSPVVVVVGVRDTLGTCYQDTIVVTFNRPPVLDSLSLHDGDTIWMGEGSLPGSHRIYCKTTDADNDLANVFITWGRVFADTIPCTDTTQLPVDSTGTYQWTLTAVDSRGHSIRQSGSVVVGQEHTVCFAGHSIVAGYGGDGNSGGFRAGVLAGLRDSVGALERVRAVGPLTTADLGLMSGAPFDDSCFAMSGSLAREMQLLMDFAYKDLTADIWVLMLGVNGGFSETEMKATAAMIHRMFTRNPHARVYVLLSPPITLQTNTQRRFYNGRLQDTVALWDTSGFAAHIVRSDSALSDSTDTTLANASLFSDTPPLHPLQTGYDLLTTEILRVMWSSLPPVLPAIKEE